MRRCQRRELTIAPGRLEKSPTWPKPNTKTMSRQLPGTRCQATCCDAVMCSGIVPVFVVSDRLNTTCQWTKHKQPVEK